MKKTAMFMLSAAVAIASMPSLAACGSSTGQVSADGTPVAQASSTKSSMTVKANKTKIKISLKNIGSSGTASIYRFKANQYPTKDTMSGLVTKNSKGTLVGTYRCGSSATISVDRYLESGYDTAYGKYYVMKGSKILKGPIYATSYSSARTKTLTFSHKSKKAYSEEVTGTSTYTMAKKLDAKSGVITINATNLIYPNENAAGTAISYEGRSDVISFESNGKTYYFKKANVQSLDKLVKKFTKAKMNLTAAVWARTTSDWNSYPRSLVYTTENSVTMAYNTKSDKGLRYFIALMEFLGSRYSQNDQRIQTFIVGNEMDLAYDWARLKGGNKKVSLNKYMEEYARGLRLANLAVKKYASSMKVAMSTSNSWAKNRYVAMGKGFYPSNSPVKNSYPAKSLVDWLCKYEKARGNYDWGYAPHAYDISTTKAEYIKNDLKRIKGRTYKTITASWKTSPWLTTANTEILQQYMSVSSHKYKGKTRSVYLTESAISSSENDNSTYLKRQAATVAQYYYRAASLPCVKQVAYYAYTTKDGSDYPGTKLFGMYKANGKKKPIFNLWKKIDTKSSFKVSNKYLKYLTYYDRRGTYYSVATGNIKTYYDVMFASNPSYSWKKHWAFKKYVKAKRA